MPPMPARLNIAIQMDPLEGLNLAGDSTYALMLAAHARGHALWHYEVRHLSLREGKAQPQGGPVSDRVFALARRVIPGGEGHAPFHTEPPEKLALAEMDVVLMRQPFPLPLPSRAEPLPASQTIVR
jgi:glutathione synthase